MFRKEVIVRFVDIGGIVDHHCLEVIVHFVDISGIVDHHCLNFLRHSTPGMTYVIVSQA
jgi:hypothetical protein